nr:CRISPR-associated endonuclease Cas2 [candidate division Zixibacteria bacterium]
MTERRNLSPFRAMWLFTFFDLPVTTRKARREYSRFRTSLLKEGFAMLQFSVYARYCSSEEKSKSISSRLKPLLPPGGQIRFLAVTEHQFGKMLVFHGKKRVSTEKPPQQLMLF